jgi:hypothetical protein
MIMVMYPQNTKYSAKHLHSNKGWLHYVTLSWVTELKGTHLLMVFRASTMGDSA